MDFLTYSRPCMLSYYIMSQMLWTVLNLSWRLWYRYHNLLPYQHGISTNKNLHRCLFAQIVQIIYFALLRKFSRRFSNKLTSLLLSIRSNIPLRDSQCGFRLIPVQLFTEIKLFQNGFQFESEILIKAAISGYRVNHVEIPTLYGPEKSAMRNFGDTIKFVAMYCHSFLW